uniref:Uncharacterized protein n=1 Tax=Meloidogyne enterolobii TaxID=390850 RepID=A0A6V7XSF1_MELEN|nr:unnamed protein product [Meloidogyne enterolobii]
MKLSKFVIFLFFIYILFNLTYGVYEGESSNPQANPQPNFQHPNLGAHPGYAPIPQTNVHGYHILTPTQHGQKPGHYGNLISFNQSVPGYAPSSGLPVGETRNNIISINQNHPGHVNQHQTSHNPIQNVQNYNILQPTLPEGQKHGTYGNLISFDQNVPGYAPSNNSNAPGYIQSSGLHVGGASSMIVANQSAHFNQQQHVQLTQQQNVMPNMHQQNRFNPFQNVPNYHILTPTQQDGQQTGNYGKLISFDPNVPGYAPEINRQGGQH